MSDVILKDQSGNDVAYENVDSVLLNTTDGGTATYVSEHLIQNQVQADWNQTDETQPDYIKNKPESFESGSQLPEIKTDDEGKVLSVKDGAISWESIALSGGSTSTGDVTWNDLTDIVEEEADLLPRQTVNGFASRMGYYGLYVAERPVPESFDLNIGESYVVEWDNVEYETVAFDASIVTSGSIGLGNGSAFGLPGNNEPFVIGAVEGVAILFISLTEQVEYHTIRIYKREEPRKAIKKELFPTHLQFGEINDTFTLIDGVYKYIYYDNGDGTGSWDVESLIPITSDVHLTVGETYTLTINGIKYITECFQANGLACIGNTLPLDGVDNGIPLVIAEDVDGLLFGSPGFMYVPMIEEPDPTVTTELPFNIKLTFDGSILKKINHKYLHQPDWDVTDMSKASYILNKPFGYMNAGTVVFDGDVQGTIEFGQGIYAAVLNDPISLIANASYTVVFDNNEYTMVAEEVGNGSYSSIQLMNYNPLFTCITNYSGMGINVVAASDTNKHTCTIKLAENVVKKINKDFIPVNLPDVTSEDNNKVMTVVDGSWTAAEPAKGVPEVTTSDNGKFLRVVDGVWSAVFVGNAEEASF